MRSALGVSLKPLVRHAAHQLTLLELVADSGEFSRTWLGEPEAYDRLSTYNVLELAEVVRSLEFGLGLQECVYQDDWERADTERARWQSRVRLSALRQIRVRLRLWKKEHGWPVLFD